jgi:hypothetical protein
MTQRSDFMPDLATGEDIECAQIRVLWKKETAMEVCSGSTIRARRVAHPQILTFAGVVASGSSHQWCMVPMG